VVSVKVDKKKCIGCGLCESMCPEVFKLGSDGKSLVKNPKGKCNLKEVADSCPVQAITVK
jgi:ferredoxin